jgi:hypothetical protein
LQTENIKKNDEIEKLKFQMKEPNFSKTQFIFEDKSNLFSPINTVSHSTKNSDDLNKLKKLLSDLKNENQTLKDENNILKMENKKACDLLIQQKSQKLIKNLENKVDNTIRTLNNNMNGNNKNIQNNESKNNRNSFNNESEINEEMKFEKTKKYRFVKPKN